MEKIFLGYKRESGSVAIRNKILIIAVDECADGVAKRISEADKNCVVLTNHYTCMLGGNEETYLQMKDVAKNPNIYGAIIVAMGCGSINPDDMKEEILKDRKDIKISTFSIQKERGTKNTIKKGRLVVKEIANEIEQLKRVEIDASKLIIGIKCGGSDFTSGFTSNPCVGLSVDKFVDLGATCIAGELFELAGCEEIIKPRFKSEEKYNKFLVMIDKEVNRWNVGELKLETMSVGNYSGGLTTIEEKSLGALYKTGTKEIQDTLEINFDRIEKPSKHGFYLSDVTMLCGGSETNFAALGCHVVLWTTSSAAVDSPITPTVKISGNSKVINDDIDISAVGVEKGTETYDSISDNIIDYTIKVASGVPTTTEECCTSFLTLFQKDRRVETSLFPCNK